MGTPPLTARAFSGEQQSVLSESCNVWYSSRPMPSGPPLEQSGCTTADGVDLWRKHGTERTVVTHIDRWPVADEDVAPPTELLDPRAWVSTAQLVDSTRAEARGDYEVILEPVRRGTVEQAVHRHIFRKGGSWTASVEDKMGYSYALTLENSAEPLVMRYFRGTSGEQNLWIVKAGQTQAEPVRLSDKPIEFVYGQRCRWWDVMPGLADKGQWECRTTDGIAVKMLKIMQGSSQEFVAVHLDRKPVPLSNILPGPEITSPAAWDLCR
jgi:hypothetical protein